MDSEADNILLGPSGDTASNEENENSAKNTESISGIEVGPSGDAASKEDSDNTSKITDDTKEEDEWMDVLGNGKLKKKVIKRQNEDAEAVQMGDRVKINVTGHLDDGTEVDTEKELSFILGDEEVVQALDLCTALMVVGETSEVQTDAQYAYGTLGRKPDIPPDAHITYQIEVLSTEKIDAFSDMPLPERLSLADRKRERGNYFYSRNEFSSSINSYSKALKVLDDEGESHTESIEQLQDMVDLRIKCYNNLAAAQIKADAYDAAMKSCDSVLKSQPDNVKALFRKGKCLAAKGNMAESIKVLKKALKLEPDSKIIHQELARITSKQKSQEQSERAMYQRMFASGTTNKKSGRLWPWWVWVLGSAAGAAILSAGIASYRHLHI